ncbi:MAG: DUF2330 domain-containing protein [Actinomycetota bacterium]
MLRRFSLAALGSILLVLFVAGPAFACGGLVSPNGTVQLGRTTTLAAYHDGVEHYVTQFTFEGSGAAFGSIVPLPAAPTKVIKAGRWTLQRLELEVNPPTFDSVALAAAPVPSPKAAVIMTAKVAALDVTVLKGGGTAVGNWAREHGFVLSPDAPAVLDFYGSRSPYFMAVEFNEKRAAALGQQQGQGTPVHVVIPTSRPWVPLRILTLGAGKIAPIDADVFLLNDREPALLPRPVSRLSSNGLIIERSERASSDLLNDLRSDRGMSWLPDSGMWFTFLRLSTQAKDLTYDLAIDPSGAGHPSPVDAGLRLPAAPIDPSSPIWPVTVGLVATAVMVVVVAERRRIRVRP